MSTGVSARSCVADLDGGVHYERWAGPHERTFVCLHGLGETHASWRLVAPGLAERGTVLAVDFPSFGLSPRSGRSAGLADNRRLVRRFLQEVVGGPAVLVGASYGGGVAALTAAHHPELVEGLVLSNSYLPPVFGGLAAPATIAGLLAERVREGVQLLQHLPSAWRHPDRFTRAALRTAMADPGRLPSELTPDVDADDVPTPDDQKRPLAIAEALRSLVCLSATPGRVRQRFDAIACPVLLLSGTKDREVPCAWAADLHRRHPDWELHVFDGVGHVSQVEAPEAWLAVVGRWLERQLG